MRLVSCAVVLALWNVGMAQTCFRWTECVQTPPRPAPGMFQAMEFDSRRGVSVLFDGHLGPGIAQTWEWNGQRWSLREPLSTPESRGRHAMAYDSGRGVTVLFGGEAGFEFLAADTWEWDGIQWRIRADLSPRGRMWHAMTYDSG